MPRLKLSLDHVGLVMKDLEAARGAYEKLGFRLSARSMHAGAVTPGGPVVPWGSGNHCLMFEHGYFELLGVVDPALHSTARLMAARYEGLHIVAMDCESADDAYAGLQAARVPSSAPMTLERDAAFGESGKQVRRARFRNINLDVDQYPEARFIVIEQCTRDVLWQPHLLAHPNGAKALAGVFFCCADLPASVERFERMLGMPTRRGDAYRFELDRGWFWLMTEPAVRKVCPVLDGKVDRVAAASIAVQSLDAVERHLSRQGVPFVQAAEPLTGAPSIWVGPAHASHAALQFIQLQ